LRLSPASEPVRYLPDGSLPRETLYGLLTHEQLVPIFAEAVARGSDLVATWARRDVPPVIDVDLICELHRECLGVVFDWAGTLRRVELEYPRGCSAWWSIRVDLANLVADLDARLDHAPDPPASDLEWVVDLIAWFQHRYVQIHPFSDFNGRTGRMLSTYILLLLGVPHEEIRAEEKEDRERYVAAMKAADDLDMGPLRALVRGAITEAAAGA
jgi:fido (protein-threonine AMPylation protein)